MISLDGITAGKQLKMNAITNENNGVGVEGGFPWDVQEFELDDENILNRLKHNDPNVQGLYVQFGQTEASSNAHDFDWEKEGKAIADNTNIKSLTIEVIEPAADDDAASNVRHFFVAVARNRSIQHLYIDDCPIDNAADNMFDILGQFFEQNCNLQSLDFTNILAHCNDEVQGKMNIITRALSRCNKTS